MLEQGNWKLSLSCEHEIKITSEVQLAGIKPMPGFPNRPAEVKKMENEAKAAHVGDNWVAHCN